MSTYLQETLRQNKSKNREISLKPIHLLAHVESNGIYVITFLLQK